MSKLASIFRAFNVAMVCTLGDVVGLIVVGAFVGILFGVPA